MQLPGDVQIRSTTDSRIRQSPAFLSLPREAPSQNDFRTARTVTSGFDWTESSHTKGRQYSVFRGKTVDSAVLARSIQAVEGRRQALQREASSLLPPPVRRRLYEAEKKQAHDYSALKSQRLMLIKQQRILENDYPEGILGQATQPSGSKVFAQSARTIARTDQLVGMTRTSPDIEFGNPASGTTSPVLPKYQLKRFPEVFKHHYHDTNEALFVPGGTSQDLGRLERLTQLTRGNRPFNIVTGTSY